MYEFRLAVDLPNGKRACSAFRVDSMMAQYLEPMDVCTDNLTALALGGKTVQQAERIKVDRQRLASVISRNMTTAILRVLEEQDTVNGYPKEPQPKKDDAS
jgi:hypothetical protein